MFRPNPPAYPDTCRRCGNARRVLILYPATGETYCFDCIGAPGVPAVVIREVVAIDLWNLADADKALLAAMKIRS